MTDTTNNLPFKSDYQNGIYNLLFLLIDLYAKEMPYNQAVDKACSWMVSLAEHIKKKNLEILESKDNNF